MTKSQAKVIWLTGLSGAGKTTLAAALQIELTAKGEECVVLDGDELRASVNSDLGFTPKDRSEAARRASEVAKTHLSNGRYAVVAMVSPFLSDRVNARAHIGDERFLKIWVNTPLEVCIERDPKGLYKKSLAGELQMMTGVGQEYQTPETPALVIDGRDPIHVNVAKILELL